MCVLILPLSYAHAATLELECGASTLTVNERGLIDSLRSAGKDLLLKTPSSPIFQLKTFSDSALETPQKMTWTKEAESLRLTLVFDKATAVIEIRQKTGYLTMELTALEGEEVEDIVWGPYHVGILGKVAESLGAVYDEEHAVGIMALNLKTVGGRGYAALPIGDGAKLQTHARNRTRPGVFDHNTWKNIQILPLEDETPLGSKIALYSVEPSRLVDLVATIETSEGLAHPSREGKWLKQSKYATSSKLIASFGEAEIDAFLDLAEAAGIHCVYHDSIFESWGTFTPRKDLFPNGVAGVRACVEKAKARGITLGAHTLSSFLSKTDPLVTPFPDAGILKAGSTTLGEDIDVAATEVRLADRTAIESYDPGLPGDINAIQIGDELIEFSARSQSRPWILTGCKRGAFGTKAVAHAKGVTVARLVSHVYGVFLPSIPLQDKMAINLARFFNETGLERTSFDGLEGCLLTGHGYYACERFVDTFYHNVTNKSIINNASMMPHFYWHFASNQSWGEPWGDGFKSAMLDHRLRSQKMMVRNKMPSKLGQYNMSNKAPLEDVNWIMSLCAGLDSGVDFYINPSFRTKNPQAEQILAAIKRWESARMSSVFTEQEKNELRKPSTIYRLVPSGDSVKLEFVKDWV